MSEGERKRTRPQRQPNVIGGRGHRYVVKVSEAESADLEAEASKQGVTVARLLVEMALSRDDLAVGPASGFTATEKRDLITELWSLKSSIGGVAVNINQIAKFANETQSFPDDADELTLVAREVLVRVEEFVAEFFPQSRIAQARKEVSARAVWLDKGWASRIGSRRHALPIVQAQEVAQPMNQDHAEEAK